MRRRASQVAQASSIGGSQGEESFARGYGIDYGPPPAYVNRLGIESLPGNWLNPMEAAALRERNQQYVRARAVAMATGPDAAQAAQVLTLGGQDFAILRNIERENARRQAALTRIDSSAPTSRTMPAPDPAARARMVDGISALATQDLQAQDRHALNTTLAAMANLLTRDRAALHAARVLCEARQTGSDNAVETRMHQFRQQALASGDAPRMGVQSPPGAAGVAQAAGAVNSWHEKIDATFAMKAELVVRITSSFDLL